jgi:hypothetical protein
MSNLSLCRAAAVAMGAVLLLDPGASFGQTATIGTSGAMDPPAVLWKDPGPIASRDLFWAMGHAERAPQGPFTFVDEDSGGTQPKIIVTDARDVTWEVKFGEEAKAEVATNRFVWAFGFAAEEMYFVPIGVVQGFKPGGRVGGFIAREGNFVNARFRRRNPTVVRLDEAWTLRENPFAGKKELSGLMILMTLVANWDIGGTRNTRVLRVTNPDGSIERQYAVTDLGASFGRMGGLLSQHSKWKLEDYRAEGFVEKVAGGELHLDYDGMEPGVDHIPLEHARWFAGLLSQLTPEQVRRAFEAAGASPEEIDGYSKRLMEKIGELQAAVK